MPSYPFNRHLIATAAEYAPPMRRFRRGLVNSAFLIIGIWGCSGGGLIIETTKDQRHRLNKVEQSKVAGSSKSSAAILTLSSTEVKLLEDGQASVAVEISPKVPAQTCSSPFLKFASNELTIFPERTAQAFSGDWPHCQLTLTPAANASGKAQATVTLASAEINASVQLAVDVLPVNDAPELKGGDLEISMFADQDGKVALATGTDVDMDTIPQKLSFKIVESPQNGKLSDPPVDATLPGQITFTPIANYVGGDAFTYSVCDNGEPVLCAETIKVNINVESAVPQITSVAVPASSTYSTTQNLDFTVTFSRIVNVSGTPQLDVVIGSTTRAANYISGSASASLVFRYTIASGEADADGITVSTPLALNGGSILDDVGNAALLNFTPPNAAGVIVAVNNAPTIAAIADQSTPMNTALNNMTITIGDTDGTMVCTSALTKSSSDAALLPNANITIGGIYPSCTVSMNPASNQYGSTNITLTVSDGVASAQQSFALTVVPPNLVLGQSDFVSNTNATDSLSGQAQAAYIFTNGTKFILSEPSRHRVKLWNAIPSTLDNPDVILGQADGFSTLANAGNAAPSASTLNQPSGVWTDGTKIVLADRVNNRVLIWNSWPTTNQAAADVVVGQANFVSNTNALTQTGLWLPYAVNVISGKMVVSDSQNLRIMVWNSIPTTNGTSADFV